MDRDSTNFNPSDEAPQAQISQLVARFTERDGLISADSVAKFGSAALPQLFEAFQSQSSAVRILVVLALKEIKDAQVLPFLEAAFPKEEDPDVQAYVVQAIGKQAGPAWPEILVTALESPHAEVRAAALVALGRHKDWVSQHEPLLVQLLEHDPAWVVRLRALQSLGKPVVEPS